MKGEGYEKQNAHFNRHFIFPLFFLMLYTLWGIPRIPSGYQLGIIEKEKNFYRWFTPFIAFKMRAFVK
jgi:hypothetical protein